MRLEPSCGLLFDGTPLQAEGRTGQESPPHFRDITSFFLSAALALAFSALAIVVAMRVSGEWVRRKEIFSELRTGAVFSTTGSRGAVVLMSFGIATGLSAAFGFIDANALVLPGALSMSMVGRALIVRLDRSASSAEDSRITEPILGASCLWWFVLLAWTILGTFVLAGDLSLRTRLASEASLGPMLLREFPLRSLGLLGLLALGVVAAVFWVSHLPAIPGGKANVALDIAMRWAEACLAGVAVSAWAWGPTAGALTAGPFNKELLTNTGLSLVVTLAAVVVVSKGRRTLGVS